MHLKALPAHSITLSWLCVEEDPVCLVESCRRAIEWILITYAVRGRLAPRYWIDYANIEEGMTLLEQCAIPAVQRHMG